MRPVSGTPFLKMNGLGNDFVVVDARESGQRFSTDAIKRISDRALGIGADQFIVLEKPQTPGVDAFVRIYNADGGEIDACGNASRCVAALLAEEMGKQAILLQTNAGLLPAEKLAVARAANELHAKLKLGKALGRLTVPRMGLKTVFALTYRPELFGTAYNEWIQTIMRGDSGWSVGERELFAAATSQANACAFCADIHSRTATLTLGSEVTRRVSGHISFSPYVPFSPAFPFSPSCVPSQPSHRHARA